MPPALVAVRGLLFRNGTKCWPLASYSWVLISPVSHRAVRYFPLDLKMVLNPAQWSVSPTAPEYSSVTEPGREAAG